MSEQEIETAIKAKGLVAPRLTPEIIDGMVREAEYHVFVGSCLTVCCMTLKNGFTVTGESACAHPENFNAEIGERIAYQNARNKIWMLEGYLLKEKLFVPEPTFQERLDTELSDLGEKIEKLNEFIDGSVFYKLLDIEKDQLRTQAIHMMEYHSVLKLRVG